MLPQERLRGLGLRASASNFGLSGLGSAPQDKFLAPPLRRRPSKIANFATTRRGESCRNFVNRSLPDNDSIPKIMFASCGNSQ